MSAHKDESGPLTIPPILAPPFDLDASLARVRGKHTGLVVMHDNPDPDCMAAAESLRALLTEKADLTVTVARGGIIGRPENRAMVQVLGLEHVPVDQIDFGEYGVIALVDTQPETGNNSLPRLHRVDIVVDHHPNRGPALRAPWCDIRDGYGATSTIVYSYLKQAGVPIDEKLATAMLYAIKSETRDLGRESTEHEFAAYTDLIQLADLETLHRIAEPKVPAAHFVALDRALRRAEIRGSLLSVNVGTLDYPDLVAEIADLLLPYDKARWVMCVGQLGGYVYLSLRTDIEDAGAGHLIRKIVAGKGAAGGHGKIAGGRLHAKIADEKELERVYHDLVAAMAHELELVHELPAPLIPGR